MLGSTIRRYQSRILHLGDHRGSTRNINAVIFGGSTQIAPYLASFLTRISARQTYPVRTSAKWINDLKVNANYRDIYIWGGIDFKDNAVFDKLLEEAQVVINLVGAHGYIKDYDNIYEANVLFAKKVAEAAARSKDCIRFVHVSAIGADASSPSSKLQTKWLGEQEVKQAYPEATIIRPATMYSEFDNYVTRMGQLHSMLSAIPMIDNGSELRQPIFAGDVAMGIINALKLPESTGKTYELAGPHQYSTLEIIELIYNKLGRPPKIKSIPYETAHKWMQFVPHHHGLTRWLSFNDVQESRVDLIANPSMPGCAELYIKPLSFPHKLRRLMVDHVAKVDMTYEEYEQGWFLGDDRKYEA